MSQTTYNYWVKPLSREQNLELFLASKLDEIDAALGNTFIDGLQLVWLNNTQIQVGTGAAWVVGYGRLRNPSAATLTVSIGANAWGHVYYFHNAGVPSFEVSTTGPGGYFGTALTKFGDTSRRYLGSVRTDASGNVLNFEHDPKTNFVRYRRDVTAPLAVLTAVTATTETTVNCAGCVPTTSKQALVRFDNSAPNAAAYATIGNSEDSAAPPASGFMYVNAGSSPVVHTPLDGIQTFTYAFNAAPSSGGLYAQVLGYWFRR